MARKRSAALTDGELRIMTVLWDRARATVGEVVDAIAGPKPAYNTVLTMMRILERKGYVAHEKEGRAFVYVPLIDRTQARRRALSSLLERLFDGSPELLVVNLLAHERVGADELQRVRNLVESAAADQGRVAADSTANQRPLATPGSTVPGPGRARPDGMHGQEAPRPHARRSRT